MKAFFKLISLTIIFLLTSCGQPKDNLITSDSVDRAFVGMDLADLKKSYSNYQFLDTPAYYFGIDGEEKDLIIAKEGKPLMFVWTSPDKKVNGLFALSSQFHTDNGLRPGMTIREIKKIYPDCEMLQDNMTGNMEYIFIPDKKVSLCFMTDQKTIGIYNDPDAVTPTTKVFKSDTFRVQFIETSK